MTMIALELVRPLRRAGGAGAHLPELGVDVVLGTTEGEHLEEGDDLVVAVVLAEAGRTVAADLDLDRVIARSTPHTVQSIEHAFECLASRESPEQADLPVAETT